MFKPTKLLKVVSIIMIIFTVIGVFFTIAGVMLLPKFEDIPGMDVATLQAAYSPFNLILSAVSTIAALVAGIVGVSGKSKKVAGIAMGVYILIMLISTIQAGISGLTAFSTALGLILPVLYLWGLYQSE